LSYLQSGMDGFALTFPLFIMQEKTSLVLSMITGWQSYGWLLGFQDISLFFSLLILKIKLQDSFNQPYLSDSFGDFWARRWNLVMAKQLKELCYKPVIEGTFI